jgi:hypothetical protein
MATGTLIGEAIKWALANPDLGWIIVVVYLGWELRGKRGTIAKTNKMILSAITVIRALARVHDEIDTERVDDYLLENGTEPNDFIDDEKEDPENLISKGD